MFSPQVPNDSPSPFGRIAGEHIDALLSSLEASRCQGWTFSDFSGKSKGTCQKLLGGDAGDFTGCYLLFDPEDTSHPYRYVGISRNVIGRIWTHYRGHDHRQTSLIYKIAAMGEGARIREHRPTPRHEVYRKEFSAAQALVRKWRAAHVRVDDHLALYVLEVAAAMRFQTGVLNCFKTH